MATSASPASDVLRRLRAQVARRNAHGHTMTPAGRRNAILADLLKEAADEIEKLRAERDDLDIQVGVEQSRSIDLMSSQLPFQARRSTPGD
jgi:hypothetical protein